MKPSHCSYFALMALASCSLFFGTANLFVHIPYAVLVYPAVLYILGTCGSTPFRLGWGAGIPGAAASLYWIAVAAHKYGAFPWALAAPCSILLGMYVALWGGAFSWLMFRLRELTPCRRALSAGLVWMLLEWGRGWFVTGFPWLTLSSGLAAWPLLLQPLSLMGTYAYSGLLTAVACLLVEGICAWSRDRSREFFQEGFRCAMLALLLLGGCLLFGAWRISSFPARVAEEGVPVTMTMVQGNIRQDMKWSQENQRLTLEKYIRLSVDAVRRSVEQSAAMSQEAGGAGAILPVSPVPDAKAAAAEMGLSIGEPRSSSQNAVLPDMLLWPETAMPFAYPASRNSEPLRAFVRDLGIPLVFGAPGVEYRPGGRVLFNRAFLLTENGDAGKYAKEHLVPFGEYLPPVLDWKIFEPLLQGLGGFTAGGDEALFLLEPQGRPAVPLGMLICYEAIFPELARQRVADGAQMLLNVSNDAWYDFTSAPMQHLHLSLMRAVEQGRWVARSTNSGITAFLDPLGGIHAMGKEEGSWALFQDGVHTGIMLALQGHTPYFYLHPWLPALAVILLAALCLPLCRRFRRFTYDYNEKKG